VIDFNPIALEELKAKGIPGVFGDISSIDTLAHAEIGHAKYIISTIPDLLLKGVSNQDLVRMCKTIAPKAIIAATADDDAHESLLRQEGAGIVVRPYELVGGTLAGALTKAEGGGASREAATTAADAAALAAA